MKIIVDTNLWISFLIGKRLSLLKKLLTNSDITVYVCDELIQEFKDVSQRGKIRKCKRFILTIFSRNSTR